MILLIDNYDSFTWNLQAQVAAAGVEIQVVRNDHRELLQSDLSVYSGLMISPGPGRPADAGISAELIRRVTGKIPVLGICLGHQLIIEMYGGKIVHAPEPRHGKTSYIRHTGTGIFRDISSPCEVMRYHSLVADSDSFPDCLEITARTEEGIIMGFQHKMVNLAGVQFHPESILTAEGNRMMLNWLETRAKV